MPTLRKKKDFNKMSLVFYLGLSFLKSHSNNVSFHKSFSEILMMIIELFKEYTMKFLRISVFQCLSCVITKLLATTLPGVGIENLDSWFLDKTD